MSETNKAYAKATLLCIVVCALLYIYANLSQWHGKEIDTTGMSAEQVELLERWMK